MSDSLSGAAIGSCTTGIEDADDLALDRDRVRHGDVAVEQVADALRDHRLAVSRRAVDEQRVTGVHRRPEGIDHAVAEHEVPARLADPLARGAARHRGQVRLQVGGVLGQRHRGDADVVVLLQEQHRPGPAGVEDAVFVGRRAEHRPARHLDVPGIAQLGQRRLDHGETQPETAAQLGAGEVARQVQRLQDQLQYQIERQPGLGERQRRGRVTEHAHSVVSCRDGPGRREDARTLFMDR